MSRRPAITPTDTGRQLPANPAWSYSPPVASRDGKVVWIDATVLSGLAAHNAAAQKRGNGRGWGR